MTNYGSLVFFSLFALILGSFFGCSSSEVEPSRLNGYQHYPTEVGNFWEYQMDSTTYDNQGASIKNTTSYYREAIVDADISETNDTSYILEISRKKEFDDDWETTDVYTIIKNTESLIKVEENLRFKKMVYPFVEGIEWDGNLFNEQTTQIVEGEAIQVFLNWNYKILSLGESLEVNGRLFDNVAIIQQADETENLILKRTSQEKYQEGVGMIQREMCILNCQDCSFQESWQEKAEEGFILTQTLYNSNL